MAKITKKAAPKKAAKKTAAKKVATTKKVAAKKAAPKKAAGKKVAAKKPAPKKAAVKKAEKKVVTKKAAPKKVTAKKVAPKKAVAPKKVVTKAVEIPKAVAKTVAQAPKTVAVAPKPAQTSGGKEAPKKEAPKGLGRKAPSNKGKKAAAKKAGLNKAPKKVLTERQLAEREANNIVNSAPKFTRAEGKAAGNPGTKPVKNRSLTEKNALLDAIVEGLQEKKAKNIKILDLTKLSNPVTDFFVIADAESRTHVDAIADTMEEVVKKKTGEKAYHSEGHQVGEWILVDYINIVVHIFQRDIRDFYNIEALWADAEVTDID